MNTVLKSARSAVTNTLKVAALGVCALALTMGTAEAQHHGGGGGGRGFGGGGHVGASAYRGGGGYHGGGGYYRGGGRGWGGAGWAIGGLGIGLGIAALSSSYYAPGYYGYPYGYGYGAPVYYTSPVVADPGYVDPGVEQAPPPVNQSRSSNPAPIFYPRSGQSASQTERDRQECNRWATTQQDAMNDANVFQRATLACMDGRGYTVR
jgi:hypothetical protein